MEDKPKTQLGLAALIASIGIPVAQLLIGYYEQHTIRQQNLLQEQEKRRLEVTKLFLDNYVDKKSDVQIATIQIMKALDPVFFLSVEEGLKETSKSDTVKASLRRATIEAATEINSNSTIKNKKVQKVLSAKEFEDKGYDLLLKGDFENAQKNFSKANENYPTFYSIEEFNKKYPDNAFTVKEEKKGVFRKLFKQNSTELSDELDAKLNEKLNEKLKQ